MENLNANQDQDDEMTDDERIAMIDAAIADAKENQAVTVSKGTKSRLTPDERAAQDKAKDEERALRAAKREERAKELKEAKRQRHLAKVMKAKQKLPAMSENAQTLFDTVTSELTSEDTFALAENLLHNIRVVQTVEAVNVDLTVGQVVTIKNGVARHIGKTGTVTKVQRIRCYVELADVDKPVYLFKSDCAVVEPTS